MGEEQFAEMLNKAYSEREFDERCINRFNNIYINKQTFFYVEDKEREKWFKFHPEKRVYFVDEQERTIVKIVDQKQMELIWNLYITAIEEDEEKWLLDYKKSGYYYFKNFDDLKRWEKEIEKVYDKYEFCDQHQKEIDIEKAIIAKQILEDYNDEVQLDEIEKD